MQFTIVQIIALVAVCVCQISVSVWGLGEDQIVVLSFAQMDALAMDSAKEIGVYVKKGKCRLLNIFTLFFNNFKYIKLMRPFGAIHFM